MWKKKNYLEHNTIRFFVKNKSKEHQNFPCVEYGVDDEVYGTVEIDNTIQSFCFDFKVYERKTYEIFLSVKNDEWKTGEFEITDISVNGCLLGSVFYRCDYFPEYDRIYLQCNPDAPRIIHSSAYIGNGGKWIFYFAAPFRENNDLGIL